MIRSLDPRGPAKELDSKPKGLNLMRVLLSARAVKCAEDLILWEVRRKDWIGVP